MSYDRHSKSHSFSSADGTFTPPPPPQATAVDSDNSADVMSLANNGGPLKTIRYITVKIKVRSLHPNYPEILN